MCLTKKSVSLKRCVSKWRAPFSKTCVSTRRANHLKGPPRGPRGLSHETRTLVTVPLSAPWSDARRTIKIRRFLYVHVFVFWTFNETKLINVYMCIYKFMYVCFLLINCVNGAYM